MNAHTSPVDTDRPLDNFTNCHVGIVAHLMALDRLPALLEPARQARTVAAETLKFFDEVVREHHAQEERELFPAVLASAVRGEERDRVQVMVDRLTQEHRGVEAAFERIAPALKAIAKGRDAELASPAVSAMVAGYLGHAGFEEQHFLPLAQTILGRNPNHMAALGISLHMRHSVPEFLSHFGHRV